MKCFFLLFIMSLFSFKLNAQTGFNTAPAAIENSFEDIKQKLDLAKKENINWRYKLEKEEAINNNACSHCPVHLLLTEQINKVVEKMGKEATAPVELPVKINRLKFLYYTVALKEVNGRPDCKRYLDFTPDLKPTRFDGEFQLMAEDVLPFNQVNSIQYLNPEMDEVIYYYRGVGSEKNIVVQAIMNKDGGKFRYYRYTPTASETNPYNLPDLGPGPAPEKAAQISQGTPAKSDEAKPAAKENGTGIKFKADVEMQNKYIPKNVQFVAATLEQEIVEGIKIKATSDTSLKGNSAFMVLKASDGTDLGQVKLDTKLNGKTDYKVTIPYSVRVMEEKGVTVSGKIEAQNNSEVMTMSIGDKAQEYIRSEYIRNSLTGRSSYVLAKDIQIDISQAVSMQAGVGEDSIKFASLMHVKNVNKNLTMVLDVRVDENKKATVYYQMGARF